MKIINIIKSLVLILTIVGCQSAESQSNKFFIPKTKKTEINSMQAKIKTTKGDILIELEYEKTPITVANFVSLAEGSMENTAKPKGTPYYDGLKFHRVIPDFMAQGGDPLGNGTGGSGQNIDAEFSSEKHIRGTVSMARAQDPNSADSQFFICFTDASWLDGQYTIWGQVVEGMEHVDKIKKGDGSNGEVSNPDKIISMKLISKKPKKTKN